MIYLAYAMLVFHCAVALLFTVSLLLNCDKPSSTFAALLIATANASVIAFLLFGQ